MYCRPIWTSWSSLTIESMLSPVAGFIAQPLSDSRSAAAGILYGIRVDLQITFLSPPQKLMVPRIQNSFRHTHRLRGRSAAPKPSATSSRAGSRSPSAGWHQCGTRSIRNPPPHSTSRQQVFEETRHANPHGERIIEQIAIRRQIFDAIPILLAAGRTPFTVQSQPFGRRCVTECGRDLERITKHSATRVP
jgi:hypothetical protein